MSGCGVVRVVCAIDTEGYIQDSRKPDILSDWNGVDQLIQNLTSLSYRNQFPDSFGGGLVFSWFILTLTGFKTNPFNRPMGYHLVYDHYMENHRESMRRFGDGVYWHYHQPPPSGIGNEWCADWTHTTEYHNILSRLLIDRHYFPSCFRAGGRIETNDLSEWLEQWIPFDYSNAAGKNVNWDRVESDGRKLRESCDWTRASDYWKPYHPASDDYQKSGSMKRWIFRCPDLASPVHVMQESDIEEAFQLAANGVNAVLAFFEHDRRNDVKEKIHRYACEPIARVAAKYPQVRWKYENALNAAAKTIDQPEFPSPQFQVEIRGGERLVIRSKEAIFGPTPFCCVVRRGDYEEIPVHVIGKGLWMTGALAVNDITKIGIAANSPSGHSGVLVLDYKNGLLKPTCSEGVLCL